MRSEREANLLKAPLLLHYAEKDERITSGWPAYGAALKAAGVHYQAYIYPGVEHGFNNDTTPRYDEAAAKLAWKRTIEFLKQASANLARRATSYNCDSNTLCRGATDGRTEVLL